MYRLSLGSFLYYIFGLPSCVVFSAELLQANSMRKFKSCRKQIKYFMLQKLNIFENRVFTGHFF